MFREKIMRKQTGFTLMELMIVIAIIAVIAVGTLPNLLAWRNNAQLSAGTRQVYTDLQVARRAAIKRNRTVTVSFDTAAETYTINIPGLPAEIKRMPPAIEIDGAEFGAATVSVVSFNHLGFARTNILNASSSGWVTISRAGIGRIVRIDVDTGGSIRIAEHT